MPADRVEETLLANGQRSTMVVRDTRREDYDEIESLTKIREVMKLIPIAAEEIHQTADLEIRMNAIADHGPKIPPVYRREGSASYIDHSHSLPEFGLNPSHPQVRSESGWFDVQTDEIAEEFKLNLVELWQERFCLVNQQLSELGQIENRLRCAREGLAGHHPWVDEWFLREFGVNFADWLDLESFLSKSKSLGQNSGPQ